METNMLDSDPKSGELKFINYKGKRILYQNFSNCTTEQCHKGMEEGRKIASMQPVNSILNLVDIRDTDFDMSVVDDLKKYASDNQPYSKKTAIVGVEGLKKIIMNAVVAISGREFETFNDVQSAKEALIKD